MAGLVVVYTAAAAFLNYHEAPRPSDAVVLFIGPDYPERKKEARQLALSRLPDSFYISLMRGL